MDNKFISTIVTHIRSVIGWLGGGLVGITAILSAMGYLVIRSHQDLLGITGFVPIPPETWSIEGARFIYNSLFYLVGTFFSSGWVFFLVLASVLLSIITTNWSAKIHRMTKHPMIKALIVIVSFVGVFAAIRIFVMSGDASHLLTKPPVYDDALAARSDDDGIRSLRMQYALLESILLFSFVWLKSLPQILTKAKATDDSTEKKITIPPWLSHWYQVLWFLFLVLLLLLPMNYGKMARSNHFFKVQLFGQSEDSTQPSTVSYEGWLLHKDADEIVLYTSTPAAQQVHIFERGQFAHIQTVTFGNIFFE